MDRVIIATLNTERMRKEKLDQLKVIIDGNINIHVITESKLDNTLPAGDFVIDGYKHPYRKDRNQNGGGIQIYVCEDIPSKLLADYKFPDDIEGI